jgi:hypothetical protein
MHDRGKDLSITRTEDDQDITPDFTYEELQKEVWADLDEIFDLPVRKPGDIDVEQFSSRYGLHQNTAWSRMRKMVATGKYQFVVVKDDSSNSRRRKVIRKIKEK